MLICLLPRGGTSDCWQLIGVKGPCCSRRLLPSPMAMRRTEVSSPDQADRIPLQENFGRASTTPHRTQRKSVGGPDPNPARFTGLNLSPDCTQPPPMYPFSRFCVQLGSRGIHQLFSASTFTSGASPTTTGMFGYSHERCDRVDVTSTA